MTTSSKSRRAKLSRRGFIRGLAAAGGVGAGLMLDSLPGWQGAGGMLGLDPALAHAADPSQEDLHFVFCYFGGGWDVLVSLDPRDPAEFTLDRVADTRINPGYDLLEGAEANPLIQVNRELRYGKYLSPLLDSQVTKNRLLVIRGMSMETLTHEVGRRRFITGRNPIGLRAKGSSADTWLASSYGAGDKPLSNLSLRVESYNADQPPFASAVRVNGLSDMLRMLTPEGSGFGEDQALLSAFLESAGNCETAKESPAWLNSESSRQTMDKMLRQELYKEFQLHTRQPIMDRFNLSRAGNSVRDEANARAAIAGLALTEGFCRCVSMSATNKGLDTHFSNWATEQGPAQREGFDAIARLAEYLEATPYKGTSKTWLDHTIIVGFSEFSRTPMINSSSGRDHWLTNSCLMLGGPVKGGRAIGASSDVGMNPQAVDLKTGRLKPDGEVPRPDHVLQALYDRVGLGEKPELRVKGYEAIFG